MKQLLIAATVIVLSVVTRPLAAQTSQQVYQQALVAERAKGDLEEAIKLYQRAAKDAGADRALAAKALLAAARCYEKLGQDGARKLYEEVAKLYADQREQATAARARLAALAPPPSARKESGLVVSQLVVPTSAFRYMQFAGTEVAYLDWRTHDLMVADAAGKPGRVVLKHPDGQGIESFSVAPNGRDIAVLLLDSSRAVFCVTSVRGGTCRTVLEQPARTREQTVRGWSPDSRRFLAQLRDENGSTLVSVGAADGSVQKLAAIPLAAPAAPNYLKSARYSPDGKFVAWTHEGPAEDLPRNGKVHLVSADGTGEGLVVDDAASMNKFLEWTPDGRHVLFLSNRDGEQALFLQEVAGGRPVGAARHVARVPQRVYYSSILSDGSLVYSTTDSRNEFYTTSIDSNTGAFVGDLRPLSQRPVSQRGPATWSRDGRQYAYLATVGDVSDSRVVLVVGDVDSGREQLVSPPSGLPRASANNFVWLEDSLYLATGPLAIERVNRASGARNVVFTFAPGTRRINGLSAASNGSDLLVSYAEARTSRFAPLTGSGVIRVNTATGQATDVVAKEGARLVVLSDDESWAAALDGAQGGRISIKAIAGSAWKDIANLSGEGAFLDLKWMPGGRALRIVHEGAEDASTQAVLLRVPVDGGAPQKIGEPQGLGHMHAVQMHPDGRQMMFHTLLTRYELWSIRNYLPAATPAAAKR